MDILETFKMLERIGPITVDTNIIIPTECGPIEIKNGKAIIHTSNMSIAQVKDNGYFA